MNQDLKNKKAKYEDLKEKATQKYHEAIQEIDKIISAIDEHCEIAEGDTFETIVFKKYLELENVTKVAKYINELGHRIKTDSWVGEKKYIGKDISDILMNNDIEVNQELREVVQYLHLEHYKAVSKIWV